MKPVEFAPEVRDELDAAVEWRSVVPGISLASVERSRVGVCVAAVALLCFAIPPVACGGRTVADEGSPEPSDASTGGRPDGDSGALAFPVGAYTRCARGQHTANGNFLNVAGFEGGAVLTLKQSGSTLAADYVDLNGRTHSYDFQLATSTTARLAPAGQTVTGFTGLCVKGVGLSNEQPFDAEMSASAGALTYDSGAVFVSLAGPAEGDGGDCPSVSTPAASWLVCDRGPSSDPIDDAVPSPVPQFPTGRYACSSQIETFYHSDGIDQYVASSGDKGTLTLSQAGGDLSVAYENDSFIAMTAHFSVTTATTAKPATGQSVTLPCEVPISSSAPASRALETLPVAGGSLMVADSTLFVSLSGAMDQWSSCDGAQKAATLICTKE
jgi:hypothetical protein